MPIFYICRQGTSPEAQPTNTNVLNQIQEQFKRQQEERYDPEDPGKIKQEDEDSQPSAFHLPSGQNAVKVEYPLQSRQEPEPEPQLPFLGGKIELLFCHSLEVEMNSCCSSRKVDFGQDSGMGQHFCAKMKLRAHPATVANCLKIT